MPRDGVIRITPDVLVMQRTGDTQGSGLGVDLLQYSAFTIQSSFFFYTLIGQVRDASRSGGGATRREGGGKGARGTRAGGGEEGHPETGRRRGGAEEFFWGGGVWGSLGRPRGAA